MLKEYSEHNLCPQVDSPGTPNIYLFSKSRNLTSMAYIFLFKVLSRRYAVDVKSAFFIFLFFSFSQSGASSILHAAFARRVFLCVSVRILRLNAEKSLSFIKLLLSTTLKAFATSAVEIQGGCSTRITVAKLSQLSCL